MAENMNISYSELDVTAMLTTHLFSPLISTDLNHNYDSYIISNDSKNKISSCPCTKKCGADIIYGNTGFGSEYLWFGRSDVFLYPVGGGSLGIVIKEKGKEIYITVEEVFPDQNGRQILEIKCNESQLRLDKNIQQVVSQTITFSFFQKRYQMLRKNNSFITTLIPTIFASRHYFDVYLYDVENDVLLRNLGEPIPIFERKITGHNAFHSKFNLNSVVKLWMLINHLLLQPKFTENQARKLRNTCGIRQHIESLNLKKKVEDSLVISSTFAPPKMPDGYEWDEIAC